jgi:hypothetical protein
MCRRGALATLLALGVLAALPGGAAAVTQSFSGGGLIVNDSSNANPYPSTIAVSGLTGSPTKVTATLNANSGAPQDLDVLLAAPGVQKVMLMSDTCQSLLSSTLTFDDLAPIQMGTLTQCTSGSYRPTNLDGGDNVTEMPAPAGSQFSTQMGAFNAGSADGTWSLFARDDQMNGQFASISSWSVSITTPDPAGGAATTTRKCPKGKKLKRVKGKKKCVRKKRKHRK